MVETKDAIAELMREFELEFTYEFVPFSKSRHAKPGKDGKVWRSLNWFVTLKRAGKVVARFDYSAGVGHCPANERYPSGSYAQNRAIEYEIETGIKVVDIFHGVCNRFPGSKLKPIAPEPADVLYSLVLDSSVLDHARFEDWAIEYGYSDDSREAERIYQESMKHALALRAAIGDGGLERLREAFQDY